MYKISCLISKKVFLRVKQNLLLFFFTLINPIPELKTENIRETFTGP